MQDQILTRKPTDGLYEICQVVVDDVLYECKVRADDVIEVVYGINFVRSPHVTIEEVKERVVELLHRDILRHKVDF